MIMFGFMDSFSEGPGGLEVRLLCILSAATLVKPMHFLG